MTISNNPQPQEGFGAIGYTTSPDGTTVSSNTSIPPVQLGPLDTTESVTPEGVPILRAQYGSTPQHPALAATLNVNADGKPLSTTTTAKRETTPETAPEEAPPAEDPSGSSIGTAPLPPDTTSEDGTTVAPDGTTVAPDGTTIAPDGTTVAPDGTTIAPDGTTVVNPSGAGTLDLEGLEGNLEVLLNDTDGTGAITRLFNGEYVDDPEDFAGMLNNNLTYAKESIDSQLTYLKSLPDSPEKTNLINFLTAVSEAIGELQETIREMQSFNSEAARTRATAQMERTTMTLDSTLDAIQEMGDERVKSAKKEAAMGKLGLSSEAISIIVTSIMILATIPVMIANPVAGVIIMTVLIAVLIDQAMKAAGMEKGLFDYMMDGVETAVNWGMDQFEAMTGVTVSQDWRDGFSMVAKAMVIYAIVATTAVFSPAAAATALPAMMEAAGIGTTLARLCGGDEKVQQWVEFGLTCAVMIATIAVSLKAGEAGKVIQQGADVASSAMNRVGQVVTRMGDSLSAIGSRLGESIPSGIMKAIRYCTKPDVILTVASTISQTAYVTVNYQNARLQSNIAELQGEMDAEIIAKDAIVAVLKDIIKKLLDALSGMNEALETLNTMQATKYQDLSQSIGFPA